MKVTIILEHNGKRLERVAENCDPMAPYTELDTLAIAAVADWDELICEPSSVSEERCS